MMAQMMSQHVMVLLQLLLLLLLLLLLVVVAASGARARPGAAHRAVGAAIDGIKGNLVARSVMTQRCSRLVDVLVILQGGNIVLYLLAAILVLPLRLARALDVNSRHEQNKDHAENHDQADDEESTQSEHRMINRLLLLLLL